MKNAIHSHAYPVVVPYQSIDQLLLALKDCEEKEYVVVSFISSRIFLFSVIYIHSNNFLSLKKKAGNFIK
jgi:hypothetical protein